MKDRVPGSPGRYSAVVPTENLQALQTGQPFTITLVRDDDPIEPGTPYSKAAVLPDSVAEAICPDVENPTPADAFIALHTKKAPAGYGLGEIVPSKDWNIHYRSGFYRGKTGTPTNNNIYWYGITCTESSVNQAQIAFCAETTSGLIEARRYKHGSTFGEWECVNPPMLEGVEYRTTERYEGKAVYKRLNSNGMLEYRVDGESTWYPYINHIGAAPAGYGLGTYGGTLASDLNTCVRNGWYYTNEQTMNVPEKYKYYFQYSSIQVCARTSKQIVQRLISVGHSLHSEMLRYTLDGGETWTEEFVTPPLAVGVEYRTTERFRGKPVYAKSIEFGSCAEGMKSVKIADSIGDLVRIEGCWLNTDGVTKLPFINRVITNYVDIGTETDVSGNTLPGVYLRVKSGLTTRAYNGYPVVYYTKE